MLSPRAQAALERQRALARLIDDQPRLDLGAEELAVVRDAHCRMGSEKRLAALALAADDRAVAARQPAIDQPLEFSPRLVQLIEKQRAELRAERRREQRLDCGEEGFAAEDGRDLVAGRRLRVVEVHPSAPAFCWLLLKSAQSMPAGAGCTLT